MHIKLKKGEITQSFNEVTANYLLTKGWSKVGEPVKAPPPAVQQIVTPKPEEGKS